MFGKSAEKRVAREADKIISLKEDMDAISWTRVLEIGKLLQEGVEESDRIALASELVSIAQSNRSLYSRLGIDPAPAPSRVMASGIEVMEGGFAEAAIEKQGERAEPVAFVPKAEEPRTVLDEPSESDFLAAAEQAERESASMDDAEKAVSSETQTQPDELAAGPSTTIPVTLEQLLAATAGMNNVSREPAASDDVPDAPPSSETSKDDGRDDGDAERAFEPEKAPEPAPEPAKPPEPRTEPDTSFEPEPAVEPEPAFEPEPAVEPAAKPAVEGATRLEVRPELELLLAPLPGLPPMLQHEPIPQADASLAALPSIPVARSEPACDPPVSAPQPVSQPEPALAPQPAPQPKPEPEPRPAPQPEPEARPAPRPEPKPEPESESRPVVEPQPEPEPSSQLAKKRRFARFRNLYESRDGGLCVFEDEHGHLVAVDSSKLA